MEHYCGVICREVPEVQFPQLVFMSDRGGSGPRFIPVELLHFCLQADPRMGTPSRLPPGSSPGGSSPTLPQGSSLGGSSSTVVPASFPGVSSRMAAFRFIPGWELWHGLIPCFTYVCANSAYYMSTEPGGLRCAPSCPPPLTI